MGRKRGRGREGERKGGGEEEGRRKEGKRRAMGKEGGGHTFQSSMNPVGDLLHFVHQLVVLIFGL